MPRPLRPVLEAMEPRILHAADFAPAAFSGIGMAPAAELRLSTEADSAVTTPRELVFIDAAVPDRDALWADLQAQQAAGRAIEIVAIGADEDGIARVGDTLAGRTDVSAVHLIAHGSAGRLQLGASVLDAQSLLQRAAELAPWGDALTADADLLIYGCDLAADDAGQSLVQGLAALTGADVAASTDPTGATARGGDWVLEVRSGAIETPLAPSAKTQALWNGLLAITDGNHSSQDSNVLQNLSWSHTVGAGSDGLLIVEVASPTGNPALAVTYGGTALTRLGSVSDSSNNFRSELWYLTAPAQGSADISVNFTAAGRTVAGASNFFGVDQNTPFGTLVTAQGSGSNAAVNVTSGAGQRVFASVVAQGWATTLTDGAGQTAHWTAYNGFIYGDLLTRGSTEAGAASVTMSWTLGVAEDWVAAGVSLRAASVNPVAAAITANGSEDTLLAVDLNGSGGSGGISSFEVSALPANGTLYLDAGRTAAVVAGTSYAASGNALTLYFAPAADWNGSTGFQYLATDGLGTDSATATASLTVAAVNDAPTTTIVAANYGATEQTTLALHGTGIAIADIDAGGLPVTATLSVAGGTLTAGAGGTGVLISGSGSGVLTLSGSVAQINNLLAGNAGSTLGYRATGDVPPASDTLSLQVNDGGAGGGGGALTTSALITVLITPVNDAPVISGTGAGAAYTENAPGRPVLTALTLTDADSTTLARATVRIVSNGAPDEDVLGFVNDGVSMGNISASFDAAAGVLSLESAGATATLAQWQAALRSVTYVNQSDNPGSSTRNVRVQVDDGSALNGSSNSAQAGISVSPVNDAAVISGDAGGSVVEAGSVNNASPGTPATSGDLLATDMDNLLDAFQIVAAGTASDRGYGSYAVSASGVWTYTLDNAHAAVQALTAASAPLVDRFTVRSQDGSARTVTITINGAGDAALIGGDRGGMVAEDIALDGAGRLHTTGSLAVNDADAGEAAFQTQAATAGRYGSLTLAADGTWSYVADNASAVLQALAAGQSLTDTFTVRSLDGTRSTVRVRLDGNNDAPQAVGIAGSSTEQNAQFALSVPDAAFSDVDAGDTLSYAATRADGSALPAWLRFDTATRSFSGTPGNDDVGTLALRISATDAAGAAAAADFTLTVANVNDAPVRAEALAPQLAASGGAFRFVVPGSSFRDVDAGDTLHYTATLADGSALPAWLHFDATTRSLSGAPAAADAGELRLRISAVDGAGALAHGELRLIVVAPQATLVVPEQPPADPPPSAEPVAAKPVTERTDGPGATAAPEPALDAAAAAPPLTEAVAAPGPIDGGALRPQTDDTTAAPALFAVPSTAWRMVQPAFELAALRPSAGGRFDAEPAAAQVPEHEALALAPALQALLRGDAWQRDFEDLQRTVHHAAEQQQETIVSSIAVSTGVSLGYVVWLLRGGVLAGSMLSAMPAWQMVDPLPVLGRVGGASRGEEDDDDAERGELEQVFSARRQPLPPEAKPEPEPATEPGVEPCTQEAQR